MATAEQQQSIVAVYPTHATAESALRALQESGLDMKGLSIAGKARHSEEHAVGFYTSEDRVKFWGGRGALWGGLYGLLLGGGFFLLPVTGPILVMGPLVGWIVGALDGALIGGAVGVLAAALASLGIPDDAVIRYEIEVKEGRYLVLGRGSPAMIGHARIILESTGATELAVHADAPASLSAPLMPASA